MSSLLVWSFPVFSCHGINNKNIESHAPIFQTKYLPYMFSSFKEGVSSVHTHNLAKSLLQTYTRTKLLYTVYKFFFVADLNVKNKQGSLLFILIT
jgi:hypothetical protein